MHGNTPTVTKSRPRPARKRYLSVESLECRLNLSGLAAVAVAQKAPLSQQNLLVNTSQTDNSSKIKTVASTLVSAPVTPGSSTLAASNTALDLTSLFGDTSLSTSSATNVPVTDYSAISNARLETVNGLPDIGYMATSAVYIEYKLNVAAAGNYTVGFNVASPNWGSFDLSVNGNKAAQYSFNATGAWANYVGIAAQTVSLNAGSNTIRITPTWGSQFNIRTITVTPTNPTATVVTPALNTTTTTSTSGSANTVGSGTSAITADKYSDIYNSKVEWINGTPDIGYVSTSGAYVEYTLNVQTGGNYQFSVNTAAPNAASFDVLVNGQLQVTMNVASTGGWSNFQPVTGSVYLNAGTVKLRFASRNGTQYNIGTITLNPASSTTTTSNTTTTTPAPPAPQAPAGWTGGNVAISTSWMTSFNQLNVTGTAGNDSIYVSQSGSTLAINANGVTTYYNASSYGDLVIKGGDGNDTITVDSSVHIDTLMYGEGGNDVLKNATQGHGTIVAIGGGWDQLTGNGSNTSFWADATDQINASASEWNGHVHQVSSFWGGVSTELQGQNLSDPAGTGATVRLTSSSLWGTGPTMSDVAQGQVSDCYFLGGLQTMAYAAPDRLRELAVDLGDGTYAIQFKRGGTTTFVRVDGDLPANGPYANGLMYDHPGPSGNQWMPILEKAYAEFRTGAWSYSSLVFGNFNVVLSDFGIASNGLNASDANSLYNSIQSALSQGKGVTIGTNTAINAGASLIGSHTYTVTAASNGYITLRNPWGYDGIGNDGNTGDALVTLSASQLFSNLQMGSYLA